ncbi:DUF4931 domain-containing protein [Brevibacillus massiliensis]|uniref:DUF4931 domain-containing protein n=1 Tax=Brevibacillus massiliensis TaxID=1118054 RepID=UPI00030BEE82|nr:DUF4931 domain-containing protein [Brevibacillus massiliensis]
MSSSFTHLLFDTRIGSQKPESIRNRDTKCPFCDRTQLDEILAERGPILLVKNKYPVLRDSFQTVLIETDECESELSIYKKEHLHKLIRFGVDKWLEMDRSGQYASVLFFKNHGPYSGGTIRHPHMQIVGLKHIDYRKQLDSSQFEGLVIDRRPGVEFNLSTKPRVGFFEFNVILSQLDRLDQMADYIQTAAHYALTDFHKNCNSYNLFFYQFEGQIVAKVVPRFITSPLFIGFAIPQVATRGEEVVAEIRSKYYCDKNLPAAT